ncbi:hypothetical protein HK405_014632, partial [Cladochytrium tenue]
LIIAAEIGQQLVAANNSLVSEFEELKTRQAATAAVSPSTLQSPSAVAASWSAAGDVADHSNSEDALRASKRASMSLLKSRLATGAGGGPSADRDSTVAVGELERTGDLRRQGSAKKPSAGVYEYVMDLERTNADLREQMTVAIENLRDSEKIHGKAVANLRRANVSLQEQLHSALREVRDTEQAHNKAVSSLEADLESLRLELSSTSQAAVELEVEKRRLAREKVDAIRESQIAESADTRVIHELQKRVRALEEGNASAAAGRRDAEKRLRGARAELDEARRLAAELQEQVEAAVWLREECERRGALVLELREQLEEVRSSALDSSEDRQFRAATTEAGARRAAVGPANSELSVVLQKGEADWQWSPWLSSVREKVWEADISGLQQEIADLALHRETAYVRLRTGIDDMLTVIVRALPTPIQALTTSIVGVPPPEPQVKLLMPPPPGDADGDATSAAAAADTSAAATAAAAGAEAVAAQPPPDAGSA